MDWTLREGYSWVEDKEHCEEYGRMLQADASKVSTRAKKRGLPQVKNLFTIKDMDNVERIIKTKSWWDSVDSISHIVGYICLKHNDVREKYVNEWIHSENIWLKRVSILFQLKYKEKTDTEFLAKAILNNSETNEFFVDKAIGWALREYSKTNKKWVKEFINNSRLSKLSIREGSKYTGD